MSREIPEVKVKDYVVANYDNKKALIRVVNIKGDTIRGMWEIKDEEHSVEVNIEDVTANLGRTPLIGKVYGCNTERLIEITETKPIKEVEWYFNATEEEQEVVHEGILNGAKLLRKHNLHRILKVVKGKVVLNTARNLTEKSIIGTYSTRSASDENPDIITLKYHKEMLSQLPRLLCHEAGHGIWNRLMSQSLRAKWIVAFFGQSEVEHYEADITDQALRTAVAERSVLLTDETLQKALDNVLGNVQAATGLRKRDIWVLLQENVAAAKKVLGPWRRYGFFEGERETHVTDYGNTNVDEMFCEALANVCCGLSLPEYLHELWDETLDEVAGQDVNVGEED